jgi:hypothetical protein
MLDSSRTKDGDMRRIAGPQLSPTHWSKDFVEHLRTVHFGLVSVSLALILLLSSRPYDPRSAASQVDEVARIYEYWQGEPNSQTMLDIAPRETDLSAGEEEDSVSELGGEIEFTTIAEYASKTAEHGKTKAFRFHLARPNLFECNVGSTEEHPAPSPSDPTGKKEPFLVVNEPSYLQIERQEPPPNIKFFASWWNSLEKHSLVIDRVSSISIPGQIFEGENKIGMLRFAHDSNNTSADVKLDFLDGCQADPKQGIVIAGFQGTARFMFNVNEIGRQVITQESLHETFRNVKPGLFDQTFPDLFKATRTREDDDFNTVAAQVRDEASRASEAFEAFGIKFPSEQVTRWGMMLLIGVQLYFFLYLRQLSSRLKPDDPGWDVPWMAMDDSRLARGLLAASVIALPCVAALLVFIRAESAWFTEGFTWHILSVLKSLDFVNRVAFVLIPISVISSFLLSGLSWHFRPRVAQPVAPSQLFE